MRVTGHFPKAEALFLISSLAVAAPAMAVDWTQFRGPNHDGISTEKIQKSWPANGPHTVWKVPMNAGFSSLTLGGGKVYSLVAREIDGADQEVCAAFDAATGREAWAMPLGIAKYSGGGDSGTADNKGGDGPRSTPSFDGGKVYATSGRLVLDCFNAADGKKLWSHDLVKEYGGRNIGWENAASPLIDGDLVFMAGGGQGQALLAFDKKDGHLVWKGQDDKMTHSTPVAATILGERQIIFFTQKGLVSVAPKTGNVVWRYPFKYAVSTAMSPIVSGDIVYCSAGYNVGSGACRISKSGSEFTATELWMTPGNSLANHWSTPVCKDGYLYGLFGFKDYGHCPLKCVEIATGKEVWSKEGFGPGGCTLVDGHVLVLSDKGELVLVKAEPTAYSEVARTKAITGKCWSSPCVSNGRIYARSTREGICVDVAVPMARN